MIASLETACRFYPKERYGAATVPQERASRRARFLHHLYAPGSKSPSKINGRIAYLYSLKSLW
jgi:hypothetical protein